jgi:hypothetical protein
VVHLLGQVVVLIVVRAGSSTGAIRSSRGRRGGRRCGSATLAKVGGRSVVRCAGCHSVVLHGHAGVIGSSPRLAIPLSRVARPLAPPQRCNVKRQLIQRCVSLKRAASLPAIG